MFILQVIICTTLLCQQTFSRSIFSEDATDLGDGVLLSWDLTPITLEISVRLPDMFRWIAIGFHGIPFTHKYWEDMALISVGGEPGNEVSYLKTLHLEDDDDDDDDESDIDLYRWTPHGRQKSSSNYYFTVKRSVINLPVDYPVELVWAYGKQSGLEAYPNVSNFKYAPLTLDDYSSLEASLLNLSSNENQVSVDTETSDGINVGVGEDESYLPKEVVSDKQENSGERKQAEGEAKNTEGILKESKNENEAEENTDTKKTGDSEETKEDVETENADTIVRPTDATKDSAINPIDATEYSEADSGDVVDKVVNPTVVAAVPTLSESEENEESKELPKPIDVKIVSEITQTAVDHIQPTTQDDTDGTKTNEGKASDVKNENKEETETAGVIDKTTVSEVIDKPEETKKKIAILAAKTPVSTLAKHGKCEINPCSYSHCPAGTKCLPNYEHCTSMCNKDGYSTETPASTNCSCVKKKSTEWYSVFTKHENTIYFGVIGFSAFFTGFIVLCLACCCARKARRLPRMRKNKVSFYKVDDFDSSADEEIEFLKESEDAEIYTKNT